MPPKVPFGAIRMRSFPALSLAKLNVPVPEFQPLTLNPITFPLVGTPISANESNILYAGVLEEFMTTSV